MIRQIVQGPGLNARAFQDPLPFPVSPYLRENSMLSKKTPFSACSSVITWGVWVFFWMLLFQCPFAHGRPPEAAPFPSLVSSLKITGPLTLFDETVPMDRQEVRERLEKEMLLSLWDRPQIILWLKRSRRYLPIIEDLLKKNGIPDDFKFVAVIESALRPHVGSPKGAMGFWQFTRETGQLNGLRIHDRIDERRNIFASTQAAITYFKELHDIFNSWTLVAAAFNMGEHGLLSEIMLQGIRDYYRLYLPLETQRYVFRVLTAKLVFLDPERYGFHMTDEDFYPPLSTQRVEVACGQETPIRLVAQAAKTDFKVIKDLNPEIRGYVLAPGDHRLFIPKETAKGFSARFEKLQQRHRKAEDRQVHIVQKGENLSVIAEKYDIPLPMLLILNRLHPNQPIHPGDKLLISPLNLEKDQD